MNASFKRAIELLIAAGWKYDDKIPTTVINVLADTVERGVELSNASERVLAWRFGPMSYDEAAKLGEKYAALLVSEGSIGVTKQLYFELAAATGKMRRATGEGVHSLTLMLGEGLRL